VTTTTKREQIEAFLAEPRNIMVGAIRKDGRPQMTPNWFLWDGSRFYVSTTKTRKKYANLRRDPRVSLVLDESPGFRTVMIDGTVEIWEDHERGLPYFKQLRAKHSAPDASDEALMKRLQDEQRVLLVISPDKPLEHWTFWAR
jgi:PPOX class probable F420-dependent enzyme